MWHLYQFLWMVEKMHKAYKECYHAGREGYSAVPESVHL